MSNQWQGTSEPVLGVTVSVMIGEDGYPVVQIDTDGELTPSEDGSPQLRVHVNDCCVLNDTPYADGAIGW